MKCVARSFLLVFAVVACDGAAPIGDDCQAGAPIACTCADGRPGTRTCGSDVCDCGPIAGLLAEPAALDFGEVLLGEARDAVLLLRNRTASEVMVAAELLGHGAFSLPDGAPAALPANGSVSVVVRFRPVERGAASARLRLAAADPGVAAVEVPVTGSSPLGVLSCTPATVAFPETWVGARATAEVVCTNVGIAGDEEDGTITLERLEVTGAVFGASWAGPSEAPVLDPGEQVRIGLRFSPVQSGAHRGTLTVVGDRGRQAVELSGSAVLAPRGVGITPASLDFGEVSVQCESVALAVEVVNSTGGTLHVGDGRVTGGSDEFGEFFLRSEPPRGHALEPGRSVSFWIAYVPVDRGVDLGTFEFELEEQAEPFVVPLRGLGGGDVLRRESFQQSARPKVDILVVLHNGTSMVVEASRVVSELGGLPAWLADRDVDFRLAVTTSGLESDGTGCPGGVEGGEDGRFFPVDGSRPRVLDEHTPELAATWAANLAVGACRAGAPQVLEAAVRALTPPLSTSADDPRHPDPADGNLGFLRPDAMLQVIAVADRADASPASVGWYYDQLQGLKGIRNTHLFRFDAITGNRGIGCWSEEGGSATSGDRLIDFAEFTPGGGFVSICSEDWIPAVFPFSTGRKTCFFLSAQPEDLDGDGAITAEAGELRVLVDGVEVPPIRDGEPVWYYSPDSIGPCFEPGHIPGWGASVEVEYYVSGCEGW